MSRPQLMGIVNRTPDSFSGDGSLSATETLAHIDVLLAAGAQVIDLGAESTRPGAGAITEEEEWKRLKPILEKLSKHPARNDFWLSLDSYRPTTVQRAIELGIDMVNDVTGLRSDAMLQVLSKWDGNVVVMHALTVPADPEITWDESVDAVAEILRWKQAILQRAASVSIDSTRLIFDPGIGFGKTAAQSLALIAHTNELVDSGGRWLIGHSRKSFLKTLAAPEAGATARDDATLALSALLAQTGVHFLRVHDVVRHKTLLDSVCT